MIKLKLIEEDTIEHSGYGAGSGYVIHKIYECPCGKGTVTYEKDEIPGFRDKGVYCDCDTCRKKYTFSRGIAIED